MSNLENPLTWEKISGENLDLDYALLFSPEKADKYFSDLESTVRYFDGDLTKVKIFGKWQSIPRQQVWIYKQENCEKFRNMQHAPKFLVKIWNSLVVSKCIKGKKILVFNFFSKNLRQKLLKKKIVSQTSRRSKISFKKILDRKLLTSKCWNCRINNFGLKHIVNNIKILFEVSSGQVRELIASFFG